jgi:xyloglucan 6-xylosyltransferase
MRKLKGSPPSFKNMYGGWGGRQQKNARLTLMCGLLTILILRGSIAVHTSEFEYFQQQEAAELALSNFRLGPEIKDWDQQREEWKVKNPGRNATRHGKERVMLVTGSQAQACKSDMGDHFLLKALKNKIDYARIHDMDIYYSMAILNEEMDNYWVKLPLVRKMMLAHPEAEWIWWMDSDTIITDMAFEMPMEKYVNHNMVVHGFPWKVFDEKDWCGLNAGIFLVRNNQWTLDLLDMWAPMGEKRGDNRDVVGRVMSESLSGRAHNFEVDDQSALVYLLNTLKDVLSPKVFLEHSYYLHGFWVILTEKYEEYMQNFRPGFGDHRWPFVTHFVGCKYCSGSFGDYDRERCITQMDRAFNFADNQVLQIFGFQHNSLTDSKVTRVREDTDRPLLLLTENLWTNTTILF